MNQWVTNVPYKGRWQNIVIDKGASSDSLPRSAPHASVSCGRDYVSSPK